MHPILLLAAAAQQAPFIECDVSPETVDCGDVPYFGERSLPIVVTASREPLNVAEAAVSAALFDRRQIEALAFPLASDLLRLSPGVAVSSTGPKGTQTQIRIRGAEANHSLLFVDGIRFNDPAAGNEARFELLTAEGLARLEVVRGPQSALWGSEALGGVIAAETVNPLETQGAGARGEYGSLDSPRASADFAVRSGNFGLSGFGSWARSDGIDSFGGDDGEKDGFENRSASLKAIAKPLAAVEVGIVGHYTQGVSQYDGFDPLTFRRADTLDETDNRILALRAWAGADLGKWSLSLDGSMLDSRNRNNLNGASLNSSFGERQTTSAQVSHSLGKHRVTGAAEHQREAFRARDESYSGFTNQDRSRELTAFVGEWRADWSSLVSTDVALRHDDFSAFADATTVRASILVKPASAWTLHAAFGEGVAQPTFYDLFGFFPGSFVGNPDLLPETSTSWEVGLRWSANGVSVAVMGFRSRLSDEIVDTFDPTTFLSGTANVAGKSRRQGVEVDAHYGLGALGEASISYTYLDAGERQVAGGLALREVRRPRHSANATLVGSAGAISWGTSLAYVGKRIDMDFDAFPAERVSLGDYVLASLKLGYRLTSALEAYARIENAFDARYQDVVGYNTSGRTVYAGLRMRLGR